MFYTDNNDFATGSSPAKQTACPYCYKIKQFDWEYNQDLVRSYKQVVDKTRNYLVCAVMPGLGFVITGVGCKYWSIYQTVCSGLKKEDFAFLIGLSYLCKHSYMTMDLLFVNHYAGSPELGMTFRHYLAQLGENGWRYVKAHHTYKNLAQLFIQAIETA